MREPVRDKERLLHMIEAINNIEEFTRDITREQLFQITQFTPA